MKYINVEAIQSRLIEQEMKESTAILRNMQTKEQTPVPFDNLAERLRASVNQAL